MHLIYLDEVKYAPPVQKFYWLCGLAIPSKKALELDEKVAEIAKWFFDDAVLKKETEFHGAEIVHRKGPYKRREFSDRIELFKRLLSCFANDPDVGLIEIRIDPSKITSDNRPPDDWAFMFFVEKANEFMNAKDSIGLLISDNDDEKVSSNVGSLSNYRLSSTDYEYGRPIQRLVDTIHHTDSHHSRLIQLADIYAYTCSLSAKTQDKNFQKAIFEFARDETGVYQASKYKHWPTDQSLWQNI
jgi:hypothetical protein